jgi:demethylmenaquinone methyltransferase/2-methoxy-6-polyprenyl-1,4-benzoquinol methylase
MSTRSSRDCIDEARAASPLTEYYGAADKREYVREIFDETAPWYDWATWFLSFGSGNWYRREALKRAGLAPG